MNRGNFDWLARWKERYPQEIYSWNARYPDIDREYVTFYPCDVHDLDPREILSEEKGSVDVHLYIHIPFCKSLCPFCFFNKYLFDAAKVKDYIEALRKEIYYYSTKPYLRNCRIVSVYFGGGTPTVLSSDQLLNVLQYIRDRFNLQEDAEITVESSPLTIDGDTVKELSRNGVSRISIGVQSFDDKSLQRLHLLHNGAYCIDLIRTIKDFGINVGIDLMYRLPGHMLSDWEKDLSTAVDLSVDTISCYSLELPPHTKERFFSNVSLPSLEEDIELYYFAIDYLRGHDYGQYTVADFGLPGKESSYVMHCWRAPQHEYLAFGAGAHSFIGGYVYYNIASLRYYLEWIEKGQIPILFGKRLTKEEAMSRYFVLGVKCLSVDLVKFEQIFHTKATEIYRDVMADLEKKGLIRVSKESMALTPKGLIYVDNISKAFYTSNNRRKPQPVGVLLQDMRPTEFISNRGLESRNVAKS